MTQTVFEKMKTAISVLKLDCNLHRPAATEAQPQRPPCPVRTAT